MHRSTFPLYPTDDGWPYPDVDGDAVALRNGFVVGEEVDLDALELVADRHAFDDLSPEERDVLDRRFRRGESMKDLSRDLGCTHAQAADLLGRAIDKVRARLLPDG